MVSILRKIKSILGNSTKFLTLLIVAFISVALILNGCGASEETSVGGTTDFPAGKASSSGSTTGIPKQDSLPKCLTTDDIPQSEITNYILPGDKDFQPDSLNYWREDETENYLFWGEDRTSKTLRYGMTNDRLQDDLCEPELK